MSSSLHSWHWFIISPYWISFHFSIILRYFCSFCYVLLITKAVLGSCIFQRSDQFKVYPCRFISSYHLPKQSRSQKYLGCSTEALCEPIFVSTNMYLISEYWIRKIFPVIVLKSTVSKGTSSEIVICYNSYNYSYNSLLYESERKCLWSAKKATAQQLEDKGVLYSNIIILS